MLCTWSVIYDICRCLYNTPWPFSKMCLRSTLTRSMVWPCDLCTLRAQARINGTWRQKSIDSELFKDRPSHLISLGFDISVRVLYSELLRDAQDPSSVGETYDGPYLLCGKLLKTGRPFFICLILTFHLSNFDIIGSESLMLCLKIYHASDRTID